MNRKTLKGIALYNDLTRYCIDLAKAESKALVNQGPITATWYQPRPQGLREKPWGRGWRDSYKVKSFNSMLNGDGNENGKKNQYV